jgi:TolB-like protein
MNARHIAIVSVGLWIIAAAAGYAQQAEPSAGSASQAGPAVPGDADAAAAEPGLASPVLRTLAVLDYEADWIDDVQAAGRMAEIWPTYVATRLGTMDEWVVVQRPHVLEAIRSVRQEGRPLDRRAVGKRLGARFVLSGRGFRMDGKVMIVNELLDVESGEVRGLVVEFAADTPQGSMLAEACDKLIAQLPAKLEDLRSATHPTFGVVEAIRRRLGATVRQWCVAAVEQSGGVEVESAALKNEMERMLTAAGQKVRVLSDPAANALAAGRKTLNDVLDGDPVDYFLIGDARAEVMESALPELVVCRGSVEMRLLDGRNGQVLATEATGDLGAAATKAEAAAGLLRAAGRNLLVRLLDKAPPTSPPSSVPSVE